MCDNFIKNLLTKKSPEASILTSRDFITKILKWLEQIISSYV